MSNIQNLINQSKRMPPWAAANYLAYHRHLQVHKCMRLSMELKKTKEAIELIEKEIDQAALTLWARMITLLESTHDRIERLEERIRKLENKEVRK